MLNQRGQANIIVMIGMVAATIFVLFNAFNYTNTVGLSSQIEITAQNSIYQTLAVKDYLIQQAAYQFDEAQLFDALSIIPTTTSCGYINATKNLPFIPVNKVYYWDNAMGQTCLPNNQEILYGLTQLLNESQFSMVNGSGLDITSFLNLNLTKDSSIGAFVANFSAPYLSDTYTFYYNKTNSTNVTVEVFDADQKTKVFNGTIGSIINLDGSQFTIFPESGVVNGVLSQSASPSAFFKGVKGISPDSMFTVVTLQNGVLAVLYDTTVFNPTTDKTVDEFFMTPLVDQNVYTLQAAETTDIESGVPPYVQLFNNTAFEFEGTWYNFTVSNYPNGLFSISPANYTVLPLQPDFVYYKYIINQFQQGQNESLLFPSYQPLYVSLSLFPLYNPEVCLSYNQVQFSLTNCISVSGYLTSTNYLGNLMSAGAAFVDESFPLGNFNITGFAQYALYNYLNNVVHGVNLKTVSVNGQPKYDWYSALILSLGSIQNGANYLLNQLSRVKESYFGTTVYNCSQTASDLTFCRNLLFQTLQGDLDNLFQYQIPIEVSFLSGTAFNINILNLSAKVEEASSCPPYAGYSASDYNTSVSYNFTITAPKWDNLSTETLGIPISLNFAYKNNLTLTPTESCGIQNSPYISGYPGFTQTLVTPSKTYLNCAPIIARQFLNTTCIANVETSNTAVINYINSNGGKCSSVNGQNYYDFCSGYKFNSFSSSLPYQRWMTHSNACPNSILIDGQNFTYTQDPTQFELVSVYGGGAYTPKDSNLNWTFSSINGTNLNLPSNFSVYAGVTVSGPYPSFNLILSSNPNLGGRSTMVQLNGNNDQDAIYSYTPSSGPIEIGQAPYSASTGENNIIVQEYGSKAIGYNLTFSVNSIVQTEIEDSDLLPTGPLKFLGFSTDYFPTYDTVSYAFVANYVGGYQPVNTVESYSPMSSLNSNLVQAFGISTVSNTYYNLITLNQASLSNSYQLRLTLDSNFNYNYLRPGFVKVFGVYQSSGAVVQLAWWNQTPLQEGGTVWVNLTKSIPSALYIMYGDGAYNATSKYYDNGSAVFPLFFFPSIRNNIKYSYSQYKSTLPTILDGALSLEKIGPLAPFIYNSTLNSLYEQFACISANPLTIIMLNATYSPSQPQFNINDIYNNYNTLYPDLQILGVSKTYSSWGEVGT
jgi:hypothetical protein